MKTVKILSLILITHIACSSALKAAYFDTSIGYAFDAEEAIVSVKVGTKVTNSDNITHNIEVEIGYTKDSEEGVSIDLTPVMVNYVFKSLEAYNTRLRGYFGAGIGSTFYDMSYMEDSISGNSFTWQVFAGALYDLNDEMAVKLGYRYISIEDVEGTGYNLDDNIVELGLEFKF